MSFQSDAVRSLFPIKECCIHYENNFCLLFFSSVKEIIQKFVETNKFPYALPLASFFYYDVTYILFFRIKENWYVISLNII
jgi:hypothetical protein